MHKDGFVIYGGCFEKTNCREAFERRRRGSRTSSATTSASL